MRLRRSDCNAPGIRRRRRGKGFSYQWPDGSPVADGELLDRIAALAIPPAWVDVWICPWPHGHIQATGTDAAGRRQYRYHDTWRVQRDKEKFERVLEFGRALPSLRSRVDDDLGSDGVGRERVLAGATRLLDLGFFRIGGEQYAEENETFGIATLRKSHVSLRNGTMTFDYPAKGSIQRVVTVTDPATYELVQTLRSRRSGGDTLLAYKEGPRWTAARSVDVNDYIREAAQGNYTAKDFRTWSGTVLGAVALARTAQAPLRSRSARQKVIRAAVVEVSDYLGNTPAVCRRSYIDPTVIDRFEQGESVAEALAELGESPNFEDPAVRHAIDTAVLALLGGEDESAHAEAA